MRRLARHLFTLCPALLLAAAAAAWVESKFYTHGLWYNGPTRAVSVVSSDGGCSVYCTGPITYYPRWYRLRRDAANWSVSYDKLFDRHAFGFGYAMAKPLPSRGPAYGFAVPHWFLVGALTLITWRHRSPLKPGLCPTCGYDLRASPERCPECGTPAVALIKAGAAPA